MNLLLDPHAFLWFMEGNERISQRARAEIEAADGVRALSVASAWEMTIKSSLGKLDLAKPLGELLPLLLTDAGIELLPIEIADVATSALPRLHPRSGGGWSERRHSVPAAPVLTAWDSFGTAERRAIGSGIKTATLCCVPKGIRTWSVPGFSARFGYLSEGSAIDQGPLGEAKSATLGTRSIDRSIAPPPPAGVEAALADALQRASAAGEWAAVAELAAELAARRLAGG